MGKVLKEDWTAFHAEGGNTFQATVTCVLNDELFVHTGARLVQSAGYAVAHGYIFKVAILKTS